MTTTESRADITVIVTVYNLEREILDALLSMMGQTYPRWEAVIVDDGSTDDSRKIIASFLANHIDDRFRLLALPENRGVSNARNTAAREVRTPWLAFLDGDDILKPTFLEELMKAGNDHRADVVYCRAHYWLEDCHVVSSFGPTITERLLGPKSLFSHCYIVPSMMICRTEFWQKVGFFDENPAFSHVEDWDWLLRSVQRRARMCYVPRELLWWRRRANSASINTTVQAERVHALLTQKYDRDPDVRLWSRFILADACNKIAYWSREENPDKARVFYKKVLRANPFYLPAIFRLLLLRRSLAQHP